MHLLALHEHGSSNPLGVSGNADRLPFHPYFTFKDLVTVFAALLAIMFVVSYMPNVMGNIIKDTRKLTHTMSDTVFV